MPALVDTTVGLPLDSQQVEILGRNRIKAALIEAGLEVATPERDNGIDLIAYKWSLDGEFSARPIQIKAASTFSFGIDRKYERIPNLLWSSSWVRARRTTEST